jgi:hypothetical protein
MGRPALAGWSALALALLVAAAGPARAQAPEPAPAPAADHWTFNLDVGLGAFGFANSLYANVRPDPSGDLSDNWVESYAKPALTARFGLGESTLYGKLSAVGERTFAAPPPLVGEEASSFQVEDLYLGWRSGKTLGLTDDVLELSVGRAPYTIGHGFLLWDGGGEGGSRGGYWSNARKAWAFAAVARFRPSRHTLEAFYVDRDDVPEAETGTRAWGANYELSLGEAGTIGASYLGLRADRDVLPERDGMDVFNLRAFTAPIRALPGLALELEYAREQNGEALRSDAWTAQVGYELASAAWAPRLSYRFASFEGDDPATPTSEAFDPLLPGFHDWGTWWQGEIAGEYFLANSNLQSHQLRLHVSPAESVGAGLIAYLFRLHQPPSLAPRVTSKDLALELDAYCDWEVADAFTVSFVAAFATPRDAVRQAFGRTESFGYGMVYLTYSH